MDVLLKPLLIKSEKAGIGKEKNKKYFRGFF
jgi:hypothetical protein